MPTAQNTVQQWSEDGQVSIKEIVASLAGVFPMDEAVIEALPLGLTFVSVEHFSISAWTITGRVLATGTDGVEKDFFLKVAYGEPGGIMLRGEWESSKEIYRLLPDFIPEPIGFGKYKSQTPITYFYLSEFVDMDTSSPPDPVEFTRRLAEMHKKSQSLTNRFGFHVTTCDGKMAHTVDWEESWAEFFKRLLLGVCKLDLETNGPWPELELATQQVVNYVVPRLLGVLESEGRSIKPCIIHGDLWEGNMGIRMDTGETILFDAGSYYAHNEMELGHWRCELSSHFRDEVYTRHYVQNYPAAEPVDEFDDRIRLYSLKAAINYAAGHPGSFLRTTAYNNMCYLCEKYAPVDGIGPYDPTIDPCITKATIIPHVAEGLI